MPWAWFCRALRVERTLCHGRRRARKEVLSNACFLPYPRRRRMRTGLVIVIGGPPSSGLLPFSDHALTKPAVKDADVPGFYGLTPAGYGRSAQFRRLFIMTRIVCIPVS